VTTAPTTGRFRDQLRSWLADHTTGLSGWQDQPHPTMEAALRHGSALIAELYEHDFGRWGWPAHAGGLGGEETLRGVLYDELWAHGIGLPEQYAALEVMGPALIAVAPELAAELLLEFISGRAWWCQGFSEPEAGSDLASVRTRATPTDDGDYLLTGQKLWSSFGATCNRAMVLARTGTPESRHRGLTMFLVDLDTPGITTRPIALAGGRQELAEIYLDDVRVPAARLLGEVDGGWAVLMRIMRNERGTYGWQRQAMLLHRLRRLQGWTRDGDDRPGADQVGDGTLAVDVGRACREVLAVRARCAATYRRAAAGDPLGPETSIDKILLGAAEQRVHDVLRQFMPPRFLFGGDADAGKLRDDWWYSRATTIYGGPSEIQHDIIADRILQLPRGGSR
jgi:hypothetical protein